jgi:3-hydroxyacyl-CoA dehydrogenase
LINPGNLEDDFEKLAAVDWIIEAAPETLEIKQPLFERLESIHRKGQIVSSNTSGIALKEITKGRGKEFLAHVMVTHFFNPPRYMHLLEVVAGEHTDRGLFEAFADFAGRVLGKGVVIAKDTANFIGNRIGIFDMNVALGLALKLGLGVEQVDAIAGPLIGRPKSAVFRLFDLVGIDVIVNVNRNLFENLADDDRKDVFGPNDILDAMLEKGFLGNKTQSGFYRKSKDADGNRVIEAMNLETFEHGESSKPEFEVLQTAKKESDPSKRLKMLLESDDVVGRYVWGLLSDTLCYAADRVPEISDDIISVDNALKWGYNWEKGPFELWDQIGVNYIADRLKDEGRRVPQLVESLLDSGNSTFYGFEKKQPVCFDPASKSAKPVQARRRIISLSDYKKAGKTIKQGKMASIIDLGDGIICLEFHSKANTLSTEVIELTQAAAREAENNYRGLVVGNQGANFCLGADLKEMTGFAQSGKPDALNRYLDNLQSATLALRYCHVPTVAAVHGMVLGGGCEVAMHCDRILFAPETYIGLVEPAVGLIPSGAGCKEWAVRCCDWMQGLGGVNSFAFMNRIVEMLGEARPSSSAAEARKMGYLRTCDGITMNRDSVIFCAKQLVLQLSEQGYQPPQRNNEIRVLGRGGIAEFKVRLNIRKQSKLISEYDEFLLNNLVYVLCGGDVPDGSKVTEQYLLDLEREVFVSLMQQEKTQQRIEHTLKTGKPLRN